MTFRLLAILTASIIVPIAGCAPEASHDHDHAHHHHHHHGHDHHHHHHHGVAPEAVVCSSWTSADGTFQVDLLTDWTYRMGPTAEGRSPSTGTWTSSEDVIVFTTDADATVCGGEIGRYRWMRGADQSLRFEVVEDSCEARRARMSETYRAAS